MSRCFIFFMILTKKISSLVPGNQQDLSSVKSEDFGNVQEMSTKTLIVGPLNLRLDSSAVHRIMKMVVCALEHEYEPYGKAKSGILPNLILNIFITDYRPDAALLTAEEKILLVGYHKGLSISPGIPSYACV